MLIGAVLLYRGITNRKKTKSLRFRFVIFDFDGTLANTLGWVSDILPETAHKFGFRQLTPDDHAHIRGLNPSDMLSYLEIPTWKLPLVALYLRRRMNHNLHHISLFDGVASALEQLSRANTRLSVLSSNSEKNIRAVLGPELNPLFSSFHCGVSFHGKTWKLKKALHHGSVSRENAIFIGDELRDLEAAHSCGIAFGAVTWGFHNRKAFESHQADFIFERVDDIPDRLLSATDASPDSAPDNAEVRR